MFETLVRQGYRSGRSSGFGTKVSDSARNVRTLVVEQVGKVHRENASV